MDVRDRDSEHKGKSKLYTDERRRAQCSEVEVGDTVLVRQDKVDKFTTPFNATPHKVVSRTGSQVIVGSPTGARYARNSTFVKKYRANEPGNAIQEQETTRGLVDSTEDSGGDPVTFQPSTDANGSDTPYTGRPQRARNLPARLSDYDMS